MQLLVNSDNMEENKTNYKLKGEKTTALAA